MLEYLKRSFLFNDLTIFHEYLIYNLVLVTETVPYRLWAWCPFKVFAFMRMTIYRARV